MTYLISKKKFKAFFTLLVLVLFLPRVVFAYDCDQLSTYINAGQAPGPMGIVCPIYRLINVFVIFAGVVLLIMVAYGAIKMSMALGDPKGLSGARKTWTYAVIGAGVVLGFIAIYLVIATLFGLPASPANALGDILEDGIKRLLDAAGITGYD